MSSMTSGVLALPAPSAGRSRAPVSIRRRFSGVLAVAAAVGFFTHGVLPLALGKWGATELETSMPLPGDELIPEPDEVQTMAVTISVPAEQVWPWLMQMGVDRAGLYSYTWMENGLLHLGVTNADRIHPEWQDLTVGDIIAFTPEGYPGGRNGPPRGGVGELPPSGPGFKPWRTAGHGHRHLAVRPSRRRRWRVPGCCSGRARAPGGLPGFASWISSFGPVTLSWTAPCCWESSIGPRVSRWRRIRRCRSK